MAIWTSDGKSYEQEGAMLLDSPMSLTPPLAPNENLEGLLQKLNDTEDLQMDIDSFRLPPNNKPNDYPPKNIPTHMLADAGPLASSSPIMTAQLKDWRAEPEEQRGNLLRESVPILPGPEGAPEWKAGPELEQALEELGTVRIWSTPEIKEYIKNLPPETEAYELKEMLPEGYQGDPSQEGTVIIRRRKKNAPLTSEKESAIRFAQTTSDTLNDATSVAEQKFGMQEPSSAIFGGTEFSHFESLDKAIEAGTKDTSLDGLKKFFGMALGEERASKLIDSAMAAGESRNTEDLIPLAAEAMALQWSAARAMFVLRQTAKASPIPDGIKKAAASLEKWITDRRDKKVNKEIEKRLMDYLDKFKKEYNMKDVTPKP